MKTTTTGSKDDGNEGLLTKSADYQKSPHRLVGENKSAFTPVGHSVYWKAGMSSSPSIVNRSSPGTASTERDSTKKTPKTSLAYNFAITPSRTITESLTSMVSSTAHQLEEIWDEVGYSPEERTAQLSDILVKFRDLCESKVAEEQAVAETFHHTIAETKAEIIATSKALQAPVDDQLLNDVRKGRQRGKATLTDELSTLEATLEDLREAAAVASRDLEESRGFLVKAHDMLGLTVEEKWNDITGDLTLERRKRFQLKAEEMKDEIATRSSAVIQLLRDCQHLMNELRIDARNGSVFDQQIAGSLERSENGSFVMASNFSSGTCTGISACALENLTCRVAALNAEKRRRTTRLEQMGASIMTLWEKLRVSEDEQRAFSEAIRGLGLDTIEKGEAELCRLRALKSEMLGKFVKESRQSIVRLWDEMNASKEYREAFEPFSIEDEKDFTEELLETHEKYLEFLGGELEEMKPILRIIERRGVILRERKEYQELQKDSDRLKQRGAALTRQLMEEEKMARRIKRDLPKLTAILHEKLHEWKEKHGKEFELCGEEYVVIMKRQETEWASYKTSLSLQKKKKQVGKNHSENRLRSGFAPLVKQASSGRPFGDAASRENCRSLSRLRGREVDPVSKSAGSKSIRSSSRPPL